MLTRKKTGTITKPTEKVLKQRSAAAVAGPPATSSCAETMSARRQALLSKSKRRAEEEQDKAKQNVISRKKPRKEEPPAPWTEQDKDIFFQALLVCGKDFDKLHKHYIHKMKQTKEEGRGDRTKDQIRHFYYRTLRNLTNMLDHERISKNKEANELFSIINLGEFRRRTSAKHAMLVKYSDKLKQLIYTGETKFKYKGKTLKIKTPTCVPLQNLLVKTNQDEKKDSTLKKKKAKVPDMITVELQPRDNTAWQRVSDVSHNPHLRLKVKSEQCLSHVIEMLEKKWAPSSVRYRQVLKLEDKDWDRLPHIRVYLAKSNKLQPCELTGFNPVSSTVISFNEYLRIHNEGQPETKSNGELEHLDPASFLKAKLQTITSQINDAAESTSEQAKEAEVNRASTCLSDELIRQAVYGWTSEGSSGLYLGHLHLLCGSPDKLILEYEWPGLRQADEMVHIFAGMINKLLCVAENEFVTQQSRKRQSSTPSSQNSPNSRGRKQSPAVNKSSPSTPKTRNILPAPAAQNSSPEFKKPYGVPIHSEKRQLADAIALGKQELKPHGKNGLVKKPNFLVQKRLMPKCNPMMYQMVTGYREPQAKSILPKNDLSNGSTQVMDVSQVLSGMKYSQPKKPNSTSASSTITSSSHAATTSTNTVLNSSQSSRVNNRDVKALLASHGHTSTNPELVNLLTQIINNQHPLIPAQPTITSNQQQVEDQSAINNTLNMDTITSNAAATTTATNTTSQPQMDILSQAMSSIITPVKQRRITPTLISPGVGGGDLPSHSIDSGGGNYTFDESSLNSVPAPFLPSTDSNQSLNFLLDALTEQKPVSSTHSFDGVLSKKSDLNTPQKGDAWLNSDSMISDEFLLSNFLSNKSPPRRPLDSHTDTSLLNEQSMDDTRMSFLKDVPELGLESTLNTMINENSIDFMAKFEGLANALETPQKKS